jgi:AcrR family transcriptional regulator
MSEIDNKIRIREKARDLFMQYGIRSMSMDDIAFHLGMSKKTIYQYYTDKDELVASVVEDQISHSESCCEMDRKSADNAIDEMFKVMEMVEEIFRNMNPSVLFDMQKYHPAAFRKFEKHKNDYVYNTVKENLERGIKEELYRAELNVDILTRLRVNNMLLPFNHAFIAGQKNSLAEIEQQLIEHYLFGVASLKGHNLILKYKQERQNQANHEKV